VEILFDLSTIFLFRFSFSYSCDRLFLSSMSRCLHVISPSLHVYYTLLWFIWYTNNCLWTLNWYNNGLTCLYMKYSVQSFSRISTIIKSCQAKRMCRLAWLYTGHIWFLHDMSCNTFHCHVMYGKWCMRNYTARLQKHSLPITLWSNESNNHRCMAGANLESNSNLFRMFNPTWQNFMYSREKPILLFFIFMPFFVKSRTNVYNTHLQ
jgi:hypothetical protein